MAITVMISYSWENSAERAAIAAHLESIEGVKVTYDRREIGPGTEIHDKVSTLLSESDYVIALLTPEGLKSKEVLDELTRANERGKVIIPILSGRNSRDSLPAFLRDTNFLRYSPRDIDDLLQSLGAHIKALADVSSNDRLLRPASMSTSGRKLPPKGLNEIELKFESTTNLQFKFSAIESTEAVLRKVRTLCDLLDIQAGEQGASEIEDEYFDDEFRSLWHNGCSFRRRDQDDQHLVTLKCNRGYGWLAALWRGEAEFSCNSEQLEELLKDPRRISREFKERLGIEIQCGRVSRALALKTKRTSLDLQTAVNRYKFCHDRFYYIHRQGTEQEFSEYNAEIEIEAKGQGEEYDPQMEKLRSGISSLLAYSPNQKSKFQRGLEWTLRGRETRDVSVIAFGIAGFGTRPPRVQKQQIQALNHHIKEAIKQSSRFRDQGPMIYLATGDGMILIFEETPKDLLPLVLDVQKRVRSLSRRKRDKEALEFRTGFHSGPVFKYSDVNESLSYAGDGISIAHRMMLLGDTWQILASDSVHRSLQEAGSTSGFHPAGVVQSRSAGEDIPVFNVHGRGFGNPKIPPDLQPLPS